MRPFIFRPPACRVKSFPVCSKFYKFVNTGFCRYTSFTILIPKSPLTFFKLTPSPVFTNKKHTLFSWVNVCGTRNRSTLSQTSVCPSRFDVMGTVHCVEGCDGSASIDVSFVHVNFHREPYKNGKFIEEYLNFLARESHCISTFMILRMFCAAGIHCRYPNYFLIGSSASLFLGGIATSCGTCCGSLVFGNGCVVARYSV
jgi:hypothetical protein